MDVIDEQTEVGKKLATLSLGFVEHLLTIPKDDGQFERIPFTTSSVDEVKQ